MTINDFSTSRGRTFRAFYSLLSNAPAHTFHRGRGVRGNCFSWGLAGHPAAHEPHVQDDDEETDCCTLHGALPASSSPACRIEAVAGCRAVWPATGQQGCPSSDFPCGSGYSVQSDHLPGLSVRLGRPAQNPPGRARALVLTPPHPELCEVPGGSSVLPFPDSSPLVDNIILSHLLKVQRRVLKSRPLLNQRDCLRRRAYFESCLLRGFSFLNDVIWTDEAYFSNDQWTGGRHVWVSSCQLTAQYHGRRQHPDRLMVWGACSARFGPVAFQVLCCWCDCWTNLSVGL